MVGWQKDISGGFATHNSGGAETRYPLTPKTGAVTATNTSSVFASNRKGVLRSVHLAGTGTLTIEDHAGALLMVLSNVGVAHGTSSAAGLSIPLENGIRMTFSIASLFGTIEFDYGGRDNV